MINNILISRETRKVIHKDNYNIGLQGENLQEVLVFNLDEEIEGQAIIEVRLPDGTSGFIEIKKTSLGYELPIKSSLLIQKGYVEMQFKVVQVGKEVFKSEITRFKVKESINATATIPEEYPSWIENLEVLKQNLEKAETERVSNENERISNENKRIANEDERQTNYTNIKQKVANGDFNGATFMPNVDENGDITWTNNKGLENPSKQNIRGPQGVAGPQGEAFKIKKTYPSTEAMQTDLNNMQVGDYVMITSSVEVEDNAKLYARAETEWVFITDFSGAQGIQGEQGPQGIQGIQGEKGIGISSLEVRDGSLYVTLTDNTQQNAGLIITDDVKQWIVNQVTNNAESNFNTYYNGKVSTFDQHTQAKISEYDEHATDLINSVQEVINKIGDINTALDEINGDEV